MRKTITISLPEALLAEIKAEIKTKKFGSTSEYFRRLISLWQQNNEDRKYALKKQTKLLLRRAKRKAKTDLD